MIEVDVPGGDRLQLAHLVLDYNGTIACDGDLLPGVAERLLQLSRALSIHVITADTFGKVQAGMAGLPCVVHVLPQVGQDHAKMAYVAQLGRRATACVGNGRNDRLMLQAAALGVAVIGPECAAVEAIHAADVVAPDILAALDLLLHPLRLVATLRS